MRKPHEDTFSEAEVEQLTCRCGDVGANDVGIRPDAARQLHVFVAHDLGSRGVDGVDLRSGRAAVSSRR